MMLITLQATFLGLPCRQGPGVEAATDHLFVPEHRHLHSRRLSGQQAEASTGVAVLNRMIDVGRPDSVRIA